MTNKITKDILLPTPLHYLGDEENNKIYIKRDDMTGFAFGGNKSRKNINFFEDMMKKKCNHVVTYGASQSNHCRIVAAMAKKYNVKCTLILARNETKPKMTSNYMLYNVFGANIVWTETKNVKEDIDKELDKITNGNEKPYFIYGGAHGKLGTQAYIDAFKEIEIQSGSENFDYIFLATGTGATQAGLMIGNKYNGNQSKIVGVSIARNKQRGLEVLEESLAEYKEKLENMNYEFIDSYIGEGYGKTCEKIEETIKNTAYKYNIILDNTYTGKAFWGMLDYLKINKIENKKILFIHTGGTPLIFK